MTLQIVERATLWEMQKMMMKSEVVIATQDLIEILN